MVGPQRLLQRGAVVTLDHTAFSNNSIHGGNANGGAVGVMGGSQATVDQSSFVANTADGDAENGANGGAIAAQRIGLIASEPSTMSITHSSFTQNRTLVRTAAAGTDAVGQGSGGALELEDGATVTVSSSTFDGNLARGGDGGAGGAGSAGGTGSGSFGGAITNSSAFLTLSHCHFTNNEVRGGNGGPGGAAGDGGLGNFGLGGAVAATALLEAQVDPARTVAPGNGEMAAESSTCSARSPSPSRPSVRTPRTAVPAVRPGAAVGPSPATAASPVAEGSATSEAGPQRSLAR